MISTSSNFLFFVILVGVMFSSLLEEVFLFPIDICSTFSSSEEWTLVNGVDLADLRLLETRDKGVPLLELSGLSANDKALEEDLGLF